VQLVERPGFRIVELQLSPAQSAPWYFHTSIQDKFYVLEGRLKLFLRPEEEVLIGPGDTYTLARWPTSGIGRASVRFLVLPGIGEYDSVSL
jgi:quercetin dioxygenase-like cupin family protein